VLAHHGASTNRKETSVLSRIGKALPAALLALMLCAPSISAAQTAAAAPAVSDAGIIKVKSAYPLDETIARIKQEIASKGITFFIAVDQSKLAADAGIKLRPSTLLVFGNPALGSQFITSNPQSGLDWPVRLLVQQDENGDVWAFYTDFAWIARRFGTTDRDAQFKMASSVVESITSTVRAK
jgi:uncharacterized protein (DUF302 family)